MEKGSLFFVIREGRRRSDSSTAHSRFLFFLFLGRFNTTIEGGERKCVPRWKRDLPFDCDGDRRTHVWMPLTQEGEGEPPQIPISDQEGGKLPPPNVDTPARPTGKSGARSHTRGKKGRENATFFLFSPFSPR